MPVVTLFGRPDCHLCDEARQAILGLRRAGLGFELHEVNIDEDPDLHRTHLERIPVVAVDGEEVSELRLDVDALRARIARVRA
jgi:thioredoxin-like negative regulator of GroEL